MAGENWENTKHLASPYNTVSPKTPEEEWDYKITMDRTKSHSVWLWLVSIMLLVSIGAFAPLAMILYGSDGLWIAILVGFFFSGVFAFFDSREVKKAINNDELLDIKPQPKEPPKWFLAFLVPGIYVYRRNIWAGARQTTFYFWTFSIIFLALGWSLLSNNIDLASLGQQDAVKEWKKQKAATEKDERIFEKTTQVGTDFTMAVKEGKIYTKPSLKKPIISLGDDKIRAQVLYNAEGKIINLQNSIVFLDTVNGNFCIYDKGETRNYVFMSGDSYAGEVPKGNTCINATTVGTRDKKPKLDDGFVLS